jgi:hypothetical protein
MPPRLGRLRRVVGLVRLEQRLNCTSLTNVVKIASSQVCAESAGFYWQDVGLFYGANTEVSDWVSLVREFGATPNRDSVIGVSVTHAARLLGVSRSRVHQLLRAKKLAAVDIIRRVVHAYPHVVTFASICAPPPHGAAAADAVATPALRLRAGHDAQVSG